MQQEKSTTLKKSNVKKILVEKYSIEECNMKIVRSEKSATRGVKVKHEKMQHETSSAGTMDAIK